MAWRVGWWASALLHRWRRWSDARAPRSDHVVLNQRNIYILPSRGGWGFALVTLVLLLAAVNEQLNLAHALAFLLGGVGLSAMWSTHLNLQDLPLSMLPVESVQVGQDLIAHIRVDGTNLTRDRHGLTLGWDDEGVANRPRDAEVPAGTLAVWTLPLKAPQRGPMPLPRLRLHTQYPLGLFRAWAYWRPAAQVLVWPRAEDFPPDPPHAPSTDPSTGPPHGVVSESSDELRLWRAGDSQRSVVWKKSVVRWVNGQAPVVRDPPSRGRQAADRWVDWADTQALGPDTEHRLSRLTAWLLMAEARSETSGQRYGLRLPGQTLGPGCGPDFLRTGLDALARWAPP